MKKAEATLKKGMIVEKLPAYFLFGAFVLVTILLYRVVEPFAMILILSAVVASVTYPIYNYFLKLFKGRASLSSIITVLIVMFAIVIPITFFIVVLVQQLVEAYNNVRPLVSDLDITALLQWEQGNFFYDLMGPYATNVENFVVTNLQTLLSGVADATRVISTFTAQQGFNLFASIGLTIFNFGVMFFVLYFYYRDGAWLVRKMMDLSPLPVEHEERIINRFREISMATLVGTFLTASAQGLVAWIGFEIAGVPTAFFWATAVAVFSLVPILGTTVVWVPIGIVMMFTGNLGWGIFVLIWGAGLISTVDNLFRIIFIGSSAKLNPLLTFISVFGGVIAFKSVVGVIFGPMLLVMFLTLLYIYELEYSPLLQEKEHKILNGERKKGAKRTKKA